MKSKITKIQILKKGMAIALSAMFLVTPITYATTSLDDSYLQSSLVDQVLYGTVGSTVKEIEEYLEEHATLYIRNETQLRALAEYINNGNNCSGKEIILYTDIELDSENEWTPIGQSESTSFKGIFNGNGHSITGLTYSKEEGDYEELKNIGVFGIIGKKGVVKNLTTSNFNINNEAGNYNNVGNIAGTNYGTIENCVNNSDIYGFSYVGGIVGNNYGIIKNCKNSGSVYAFEETGGITGYNREGATIINCENTGYIEATRVLGGIAGSLKGNISKSINSGKIYSTGLTPRMGGITGTCMSGANIENVINRGEVSGTEKIGGIAGNTEENTKISNAINEGTISATVSHSGGIVGYANGTVIESVTNKGKIVAIEESAGGIAGKIINSTIKNSINTYSSNKESISATKYVAGIAGSISGTNIASCINTATVKGTNCVGGIIGATYSSDIVNVSNCLNKGIISGDTQIGGIAGNILNGKVLNCTNEGTVSGTDEYMGGIIGFGGNDSGEIDGEINIKECINKGKITASYGTTGGIIGVGRFLETINITDCLNIGVVNQEGAVRGDIVVGGTAAGIIGSAEYSGSCNLTNCLNKGNITGLVFIGGIIGDSLSIEEVNIVNCQNTGKITAESDFGNIEGNPGFSTTIAGTTANIKQSDIGADVTESSIGAKITESNIGYNITVAEVSEDFGPAEITYKILVNGKAVSNGTYLREGNVITVKATFDKYLAKAYGPLAPITEAPILKINNSIEMTAGKINVSTSNWTTTIEYTYTIKEEDKFNITSLNLSKSGTIYAVESDYQTVHPTISVASVSTEIPEIILDTTAPEIETKVYIDDMLEAGRYTVGKEIFFELTTSEQIEGDYDRPEIKISFSKSGDGKYNYTEDGKVGYAKCIDAKISLEGKTTWTYSYQIQEGDEGQLQVNYVSGSIEDVAGNVTNISAMEKLTVEDIYADTTEPTVTITPKDVTNSLTNKDKVTYEFKWSEEVEEFTKDDITVNNGSKGTLSKVVKNADGTYSYTMDITTSIEKGNVGDLQVIIEQNACEDLIGYSNVRTENVIRVDRKAATLQSLEVYAESSIKVNNKVDVVKEYYKTGEKIIVVATFDENIVAEKIPELVLQFSESKNSVIPQGKIEANKIIYTYTIVKGDEGTVSVRALNGSVTDAAGNETNVTRKALDGNTIIIDTDTPSLSELKVTTVEGTYKSGRTITIEAIYDEEIYSLENKEIKLITSSNAPELKLTFGGKAAKGTVKAIGYGQTDGKTDRTKVKYTYTITDGDNGILGISSYSNKENIQVCDIAGNVSSLNKKQTGNEIIADTIRPEVISVEPKVKDTLINRVIGDPDGNTAYYKAGNEITIVVRFNEEVSGKVLMPKILVGFSEEAGKEPTEYKDYAYESDWNVRSITMEYTYTITDGDNGYLWVKVPENQFDDIAGNGNIEEAGKEFLTIYADTTRPTVTLLRDTEVEQNDQTIVIKATFNENVYDLEGTKRVTLTKENAPILIYSFGVGNNKEVNASEVKGDTITYTITKDPVEENGTLLYELAKGNLCDRAGNLYYIETTDTTAPELESVVITSNAGSYAPYCKEGTEIYVTATFNEEIKTQVMKLKVKVGEKELDELLEGEIVNGTQVKYTYTVKAGDTGAFSIVDICGSTNEEREAEDKTYGYVKDLRGNQKNIYNLTEEKITVTGRAIADTTDPYITSIQAIANGKEIARYTKEEGKDAVITVGRTNANIVEYIVTHSEEVPYKHLEGITITNGTIISKEAIDSYKYKITVQTTVEGVQSLIIPEATVEDKAGNIDGFVRIDAVTTDFTKPTVRFISEYNGGVYVLPTNIGKVEIRPNVEISEDIARIEYKWDDEKDYVEIENYSTSSDIAVPTKAFTEDGTHVLYIRVVDLAGNEYETSKTYRVLGSQVEINTDKIEYTNEDIMATVTFGEGLTDNRKVTFKAEGSNEVIELNATGANEEGTQYTIETNGTIYAEATDKVGNKVFTDYTVKNIDKKLPKVELSLDGGNLVIGTGKDKATIKSTVKVEDENLMEIRYIYSNNETLTAVEKASMTLLENYKEAKKTDAVEGTYYLHVLAADEAGNETEYKSAAFVVANSNTLKDEEGNVTYTPTEENKIKFNREQQYVYVTYGMNLSENQEITFTNEEDGYALDAYAQVLKPTTVTAKAEDVCGNTVIATFVVESVEGPKFDVIGNPKDWTNQDIKLEVVVYDELKALTVNGEDILSKEDGVRSSIIVSQNGNYEFIATDIYGNISKQTIKVEKIDKELPVISEVVNQGKDITISATDELSGVVEYAITSTTEMPVEWSESNVIKTTKDGIFYAWAKDAAGNIYRAENAIVVDTIAPTITFNYLSQTVTVGMPVEANVITDEEAIISYSWDKETWVNSEELISRLTVSEKTTTPGKQTLYVKAKDVYGNESKVQALEFEVVTMEEIKKPDIIFEDIPTLQINGARYVKVSSDMKTELLTDSMNKEALCGKTPEYINLTEDGKLKTGTEITINNETKYIVVVNGDVNCDGKIDFLGDLILANNYRLGLTSLNTMQKLAADINNSGEIEFIPDILAINNYRLGIIKSL